MAFDSRASDLRWIAEMSLDRARVALGQRVLSIALASEIHYSQPPLVARDGSVRALLVDAHASHSAAYGVTLRPTGLGGISGECSHCPQVFGACLHLAVVAVDLACSAELRNALFNAGDSSGASARAPAIRLAANVELSFESALKAWLTPAVPAIRVEIAASPVATADVLLGRPYGDRSGPRARALSIVVRRAGERKLLSPRDLASLAQFDSKARRVIERAHDHGGTRKAAFAWGVDASLAIEAMRLHGGVFSDGFKHLLDFRSAPVRPAITLSSASADDTRAPFSALQASWRSDDDAVCVPFARSVFFPGPFPYVWSLEGAIYPVSSDVDPDMAGQLAESPVLRVPSARLGDAGARLLRMARGRGLRVPAPEAFGLPAIATPRIVLRLGGEALDVSGELIAIYGSRQMPIATLSDPDADQSGRDLECEARARSTVLSSGMEIRPAIDDIGEEQSQIAVSGERAIAFWQAGLLSIRSAKDPTIEIETSARLARVRVGAPVSARVHVALEGQWLQTRLEFSSEDLPVELEAVRLALARKRRWLVLDDGTLARISSSVEALADEAAHVMGGGSHARLPAHQLGRLDRWIEENDGQVDLAVEGLRRRLHALAVAADPRMPKGLQATLRPYQRLGLAWLQFLQGLGAGGILGDDMGLGKTITTLAFLLERKEREGHAPALVVCPTSVASNWVREAARFTPDLRIVLLHGPARDIATLAQSDLAITTYALLRRDIEVLSQINFRCVVLDEAQNIKNADGATARAAGRLSGSMRLALSGTPVENRLGELWSLASFANPGVLGTARAFEKRFEKPIAADRSSPIAAELRAIVRPFLLRRTKDDVLRDLPPKTEIDRAVALGGAEKRMYDALAHTLRESLARDVERLGPGHVSLSMFTALTRLRQMACDSRLVDAAALPTPSAKRSLFLGIVRELVSERRRALVFSQFVQLLTLWRRDLDAENIAYEYLDGSTTRRDEVVTRFQEGQAPLFLISLKAGGAGLNLTAADTVIHCDPWWNPAVEDQATDRAYRIGQDKPVTVLRLIARGTIEEKILSLKAKKRELTRAVIGDDARALDGITEEDIRVLLGDVEQDPDENACSTDEDEDTGPAAQLATAERAISPEFAELCLQTREWLATTGRKVSELAALADIPPLFAARLSQGQPFPCSRAVADRIKTRLRTF